MSPHSLGITLPLPQRVCSFAAVRYDPRKSQNTAAVTGSGAQQEDPRTAGR